MRGRGALRPACRRASRARAGLRARVVRPAGILARHRVGYADRGERNLAATRDARSLRHVPREFRACVTAAIDRLAHRELVGLLRAVRDGGGHREPSVMLRYAPVLALTLAACLHRAPPPSCAFSSRFPRT